MTTPVQPSASRYPTPSHNASDPTPFQPFYSHPCRCSFTYIITLSDLEAGVDRIGCDGCGEWVGVGYEVLEEEDEEDEKGDRGDDGKGE